MFEDCPAQGIGAALKLACKLPVAGFGQELGRLAQLHGHHGVWRNEEAEDAGVITGAECAADQTRASVERVADAVEIEGLGATVGAAPECVLIFYELALPVERRPRLLVQDSE